MLRKLRIAAAVVCFALVTLLFLDFTGTLHAWFGWLARIQFLPALLAVNVGVVAALVVATLLFGRVYCSVVCPLGVMQDGISHLAGQRTKNRFRYSPAKTALRYTVLALFIAALAAGIGSLVALLAPYSAYGRIAQNLLAPLWGWGNNLLAYFAERIDSYAFYRTDVWVRSAATFAVAAATFALIAVLAWRNGRTWCNTVCPVGTVLGFLARFSLLRPAIDPEKCVGCNRCARNCKASCIDVEHHRIDYSRCVVCMDCIDTCHKNAIAYELRPKTRKPAKEEKRESGREENPAGLSRRSFLSLTGVFAAHTALRAQEKLTDGGLAVIEQKKNSPPCDADRPGRRREPAQHGAPLHRLPALRGRLSQRRAAALGKTHVPDAARNVLRTRLLPPRMHEVLRGLPRRSDPPRDGGREVVRADRPCRLDTCQLRTPDRRRRLRQLRPPLPVGGHHDGSVRHRRSRLAEDSGRQHRALHRLRRLRKPLSGTPVQRDLRRRARTPPNHLTPETHGDQR